MIIQEIFPDFLILNAGWLNQYRGTVGMFYNCKNIYCNAANIYYNKALRIYSSFIFFGVIFICVAYLFSLTVRLRRSSSILLRAKFRISYTYVNTILYFSITLIYVNHFWLYNIFIKHCDDVEENPAPKPIGIWTIFLRIIILNCHF